MCYFLGWRLAMPVRCDCDSTKLSFNNRTALMFEDENNVKNKADNYISDDQLELNNPDANTNINDSNDGYTAVNSKLTVDEVRALSKSQLVNLLEDTLLQISTSSPSPITRPIDHTVPLTSLGLDSLTLVQYKGTEYVDYYDLDKAHSINDARRSRKSLLL